MSSIGSVRGRAPETWDWLAVISDLVETFGNYRVVARHDQYRYEGEGEGGGGGGDNAGGIGGNSVVSTRVSKWKRIHSTFDDEKRVPSSSSTAQGSSTRPLLIALSRLSFLSRADSIDTAPPPSVLLAGFSYTALSIASVSVSVSADLCGHSVQRWLGTININAYVAMTPRSGVSADDEDDGVGDEWTTAFGSILIQTANLLWAPSDVR
ncbi:uncharacterized protein UDID_18166 [Ustilago sp. UG-2017a]|nr:uncharacterized protein UDID_18166 [Ustilago sp. UG-2017a]